MPLQVGSLLNDRYRIIGVLGQGGMGAVYQATDESLGVPCAVKENLNVSTETDRLFRREASLLAGLRHHCLPRVTNHFILANQQYLVMDYIEGEDLRQRLTRDGPLPERLVVGWAVQLCDALTYLHTLNPPVVHRDIKPANIKLTPSGEIVLVDFGVAKPTSTDQKTATATTAFTPGFTPPEQYGLGRTDARADEYALGATLYTLLTGQPPPDSVDRLLGNAKLASPQSLRPDLSPSLATALTRALEIKAEDRFPTVDAFKAALLGGAPASPRGASAAQETGAARVPPPSPRRADPELPPPRNAASAQLDRQSPPAVRQPPPAFQPPPPAPPRARPAPLPVPPAAAPVRRSRWPWIIGLGCVALVVGVLALAGGGALGYVLIQGRSTPTPSPAFTAPATASAAATLASAAATPVSGAATPALSATPTTTLLPAIVPTATPAPSVTPPLTPTPGQTLAASATADVSTPTPTTAPAGTPVGHGGRIAFISNRGGALFQIYTMQADGSDVQPVTTDNTNKWDPNWPFNGTQLAWSPDGKQLIYVAENADGSGTDLFMINADGSNPVNLTQHAGNDFQPNWCGNGSIWFASTRVSNGVQQIFHTDLASIRKGLGPINFSATHNFPREYDPSPYTGCQRVLYVTTLDGPPEIWHYYPDCPACFGVVRSAKDRGGNAEEPALSADNVYLAYTLELGKAHDIVITKVDDRLMNVQVTTTQNNGQAQWSPDGQWLVFVSSRDGNREIYRMTLAGTSQTNLSNNPAIDTDPVWQPAP